MIETTTERGRLLVYWQQRLTECEAATRDEGKTFGWLWRVKARIYRFLLARYGTGDWRSDAGEVAESLESAQASRQTLVVREPLPEAASGPKSEKHIHATLDKVHVTVPEVAKGVYEYQPSSEGLWYPAGKVYRDEFRLRRAVEKLLEQQGIGYRWDKTRVSFFLQTQKEQQEQARDLLEAVKQEMPRKSHQVRPGLKILLVLLILCVLLGIIYSGMFAVH